MGVRGSVAQATKYCGPQRGPWNGRMVASILGLQTICFIPPPNGSSGPATSHLGPTHNHPLFPAPACQSVVWSWGVLLSPCFLRSSTLLRLKPTYFYVAKATLGPGPRAGKDRRRVWPFRGAFLQKGG